MCRDDACNAVVPRRRCAMTVLVTHLVAHKLRRRLGTPLLHPQLLVLCNGGPSRRRRATAAGAAAGRRRLGRGGARGSVERARAHAAALLRLDRRRLLRLLLLRRGLCRRRPGCRGSLLHLHALGRRSRGHLPRRRQAGVRHQPSGSLWPLLSSSAACHALCARMQRAGRRRLTHLPPLAACDCECKCKCKCE